MGLLLWIDMTNNLRLIKLDAIVASHYSLHQLAFADTWTVAVIALIAKLG